jgi:hypothetical protein
MNKAPIGFIKSYPKMVLKPQDEPQYQGGGLILEAPGFWIESNEDDEEFDSAK